MIELVERLTLVVCDLTEKRLLYYLAVELPKIDWVSEIT
jgi:hypothetical protein